MSLKSKLKMIRSFWQEVNADAGDDHYKYLIRRRDGTFWTKSGGWGGKEKAKKIAGAANAWNYAENHLWSDIDEIDVVMP